MLEWIGSSRPYEDVMDAWRTSCPRLAVWEEANRRGFVRRERNGTEPTAVVVTAAGHAHLHANRVGSARLQRT